MKFPLLFSTLFAFSVSFAQTTDSMVLEGENTDQSKFHAVRTENITKTSSDEMFKTETTYDIYDRVIFMRDFLPLGYQTTVKYQYFPEPQKITDSDGEYYTAVIQFEEGFFNNKNNQSIASYSYEFNKKEEVITKDFKGMKILKPIVAVISKILGIDPPELLNE